MLYFLNSIGIDTIRFLVPAKTLHKFLNSLNLVLENDSKNFIINEYFETKEVKQSRDYEVKFVKIGNTQNLSSYILVKHNLESVSISKSRKKSKSHYSEVVFAGLRQPTKEIRIGTYAVLSKFIKRFKISNMDICFDGLSDTDINTSNYYKLVNEFKEYINSFNDTHIEKTTFYINRPSSKIVDADRFLKITCYDKYKKERRHKELDDELKNWKRLEVKLNVEFKFKGFNLEDYIHDIEITAKRYFSASSFSYEYLSLQCKLLTDMRTHKGSVDL